MEPQRQEDRATSLLRARGMMRLSEFLNKISRRQPFPGWSVVCYDSALAFHELTDHIPRSVWMAIGPRDWRSKITSPRIEIVRFGPKEFDKGVEHHTIEGVPVPIYTPAKTIIDLFKGGQRPKAFHNAPAGIAHATQAMKDALRLHKATPSEIAEYAVDAGIWQKIVQPRFETLTIDA
ncbi:transcriptional regulator [Bradyrhizobium diazoefficiens]|nr:transcriptional regulator [Bradyrhizobium diazoefficiens]QQO23795.1 transcriptional regulator [Bradyrhizobium diazoefficiens]